MPGRRGSGGALPPPGPSLGVVNRASPTRRPLDEPVAWLERSVVRAVPRGVEDGVVVDDGERLLALGDAGSSVLAGGRLPWAVAADSTVVVAARGRLRAHPLVGPGEVLHVSEAPITAVAAASGNRVAWWTAGVLHWRRGAASGALPLPATTGRPPRLAWVGSHLLAAGGHLRHRVLRLHGDTVVTRWELPGPVLACAGSATAGVVLCLDVERHCSVLGLLDADGRVELVDVPDALAWDGAGDVVAWVDETGVLHALDAQGDVRSRVLPTREPLGIALDPTGRSACVWQRADADCGAPLWTVAI